MLLRRKSDLWWARAIGLFWPAFLIRWWTTVRFPFCRGVIAYPDTVDDPMRPGYAWVLDHELVHVVQQQSAWGLFESAVLYFLLPLPIVFSGRWFIERRAYLLDIQAGHQTVESAAYNLWRYYLWAWPKPLMRRWFQKQVQRDALR